MAWYVSNGGDISTWPRFEGPRQVVRHIRETQGEGNSPRILDLWTPAELQARYGIHGEILQGDRPTDIYERNPAGDVFAVSGTNVIRTRAWQKQAGALLLSKLKERARQIYHEEAVEKADAEAYRLSVRAHAISMRSAFQAGDDVDIIAGSINGSGAWPI